MSIKEKREDFQIKVHTLSFLGYRVSFWKDSPELCDLYLQGLLLILILDCLDGQSLWSMLLVTWRGYVEWRWVFMNHQAPESNTPVFKMQVYYSPPAVVSCAY